MLSEGGHEETIVYADIGRDLNLFLVIVYHKLLVTSLSVSPLLSHFLVS